MLTDQEWANKQIITESGDKYEKTVLLQLLLCLHNSDKKRGIFSVKGSAVMKH